MKKLTYLLLLFAGIANSQDIVFDGTAFKNKLLESSTGNSIAKDFLDLSMKIDANEDGEISQQEAALVYKLNVSQSSITNLVGIQFFTNLRDLECDQNDIETIDVSTLIHLTLLKVDNNNDLFSIYAKNGASETITFGGSNPNLVYICTDEDQINDLVDQGPGNPNYIVNSFCSPTPGGSFNKVTGKILFDAANNGIDAQDIPQSNIKLACSFGDNKLQTVTNTLGEFAINTLETGVFSFEPILEHPDWFSTISAPNYNFIDTDNNNFNYDFILTPVGVHYDVEVVLIPVSLPLAGSVFNPTYEVIFKNKGNQTQNGQVTFSYNASILNYVNSIIPSDASITNQSAGLLTIDYTNLKPFESRSFRVELSPITSFTNNQLIEVTSSISPNGEELNTQADNDFILKQTVPNSNAACWVKCMEGATLPTSEIGEFLHYALNIENESTANANFVVAETTIDTTKYDLSSLQVLSSFVSNPLVSTVYNMVMTQVEGDKVLFQLRNVMQGGEPGGSGGILFKVKTLDGLPDGSTVGGDIKIFFDYNYDVDTAPVVLTTNSSTTTFQNLSTSIANFDTSILVYPNPASSIITINSDVEITSVQLYDVYGRLLQTNLTAAEKTILDISQRAKGTYFLKITSNQGQKVEKIVIE